MVKKLGLLGVDWRPRAVLRFLLRGGCTYRCEMEVPVNLIECDPSPILKHPLLDNRQDREHLAGVVQHGFLKNLVSISVMAIEPCICRHSGLAPGVAAGEEKIKRCRLGIELVSGKPSAGNHRRASEPRSSVSFMADEQRRRDVQVDQPNRSCYRTCREGVRDTTDQIPCDVARPGRRGLNQISRHEEGGAKTVGDALIFAFSLAVPRLDIA